MNFQSLLRYADELQVISSAGEHTIRGFLQPIELHSDGLTSPDFPGAGGGKYMLIAPLGAIDDAETDVKVVSGGRVYACTRLERFTAGADGHIECILRYIGGEADAESDA